MPYARSVIASPKRTLLLAGLLLLGLHVLVWCWSDPRVGSLARVTLRLSIWSCALALPAGSLLGWLLARTDLPGRRWAGGVCLVLLFVPLHLYAAGWEAGFGNLGWYRLAGTELRAPLLSGIGAVVWIHALAAVPWVTVIVGLALRSVPPELEEAALLEGTQWQVALRVTLRWGLGGVLVAGLWVLVTTAGEITATDLFQVRTYAEQLYQSFSLWDGSNEIWLAGWPGLLTFFWIALLALAVAGVAARTTVWRAARPRRTFSLDRWRWPAAVATWLVWLLIAGVPLGNLIAQAGFVVSPGPDGLERSWSLWKLMGWLIPNPWSRVPASLVQFRWEFGWTLMIGSLAALTTLLLAVPLAWLARRGTWRAIPAWLTASVCLAVPGPLLGWMVVRVCLASRSEFLFQLYDASLVPTVLAVSLRALPVPLLMLWVAFRSIPEAVLESAILDGAGPCRRWLRVAFPQCFGSLAAAWFVALSLSMAELSASLLVLPAGVRTVPLRIFGLLHAGADDYAAGLSLTSLALHVIVALPLLVAGRLALARQAR